MHRTDLGSWAYGGGGLHRGRCKGVVFRSVFPVVGMTLSCIRHAASAGLALAATSEALICGKGKLPPHPTMLRPCACTLLLLPVLPGGGISHAGGLNAWRMLRVTHCCCVPGCHVLRAPPAQLLHSAPHPRPQPSPPHPALQTHPPARPPTFRPPMGGWVQDADGTSIPWGRPEVAWDAIYGPKGWCNADRPEHE